MYRKSFILAAVSLLVFGSCTKEAITRDVELRINASVDPEMAILTKSGGGTEPVVADRAILQAWHGDIKAADALQEITPGTTAVTFSGVKLAAGVDYDIYIMVYSDGYYNTSDLRSVTLASGKEYDGQSAGFDAFYSYSAVSCCNDDVIDHVTLKRPFARVSFSAEVAEKVMISFTAPTTLNLKTGEVSGSREFSYTVDCGETDVKAFDYVFADEEVTQMSYKFKLDGEGEKTTTVPVKRNTKTNIIYNVTENPESDPVRVFSWNEDGSESNADIE